MKKQNYKTEVSDIVDFMQEEGGEIYQGYNREELEKVIELHRNYGTFLSVSDTKGLVAVARWNFINEKKVHILDVIIRKDARGIYSLKGLLLLGIKRYPQIEEIVYERKGINPRTYKVKDFLRR